ncbi:MAG: class II D-tagatose-bisphosphate aldolase, non-catalytic subunit [Anaerolineales bacterium]|jgi:D-tagatose-1,6-bisphosphate aldolase subunit GatZ/KbaZ
MSHPLDDLVRAQKRGEWLGLPSICSAHPWVLKVAMHGTGPLLIESTCNQVNQFGGYTSMTPSDFAAFVKKIASENGFPIERLLLGGDHLGPSPWQVEPAVSAMKKASGMVCSYVRAGFTKIHLDASMRLADDPPGTLETQTSARRTAELARIAEASLLDPAAAPRYVIGTEVPLPGGARGPTSVSVTSVEAARATLECMQAAFMELGLRSAWERVIALVVQPGVEFGDDFVLDYDPKLAHTLAVFSEGTPFVFEAHSTDYQRRLNLRNLVRDHFAILKVGPALTYAYREAVFSLAEIECELFGSGQRSELVAVLEQVMLRHPQHWQDHYHGTPDQLAFARKFSRSDRIRYYWPLPEVQAALGKLFSNLEGVDIPMSLLSKVAPRLVNQIQTGRNLNHPADLIDASIQAVLDDYQVACTSR